MSVQHHLDTRAPKIVENERQRHPQRQPLIKALDRSESALERRLNGAIVFVIAVALVAAVGMLYLLQTSHIASLGHTMTQLQAQRESQVEEQQRLTAELAELQSLDQVEQVALHQIGMQEQDDTRFISVPAPAEPELHVPDPPAAPATSIVGRFWNRLTGRSESSNTNADERQQ